MRIRYRLNLVLLDGKHKYLFFFSFDDPEILYKGQVLITYNLFVTQFNARLFMNVIGKYITEVR